MPPKRAKTAAAKTASASEAPKTRATRSRGPAKEAPAGTMADDTDDGEGLVRASTRVTRKRASEAKGDDDTLMSDGLGQVGKDEANHSKEGGEKIMTPRPKPRGRTRPPRTVKKVVQSEANKAAIEGLKKRMEEDARRLKEGDIQTEAEEGVEAADDAAERHVAAAAEVQAAPAMPPTNISPTHRAKAAPSTLQRRAPSTVRKAPSTAQRSAPDTVTRPASALKVQSTPGVDNSVLSLANFRRRPRQPSLLQMVQNPELAQDIGNDSTDFTLGASDEEDDFAPYDESTPLQVSKAQQQQQTSDSEAPSAAVSPAPPSVQSQTVRDKDADSLYSATPLPSPRPIRKRKSEALEEGLPQSEIQVPRSQPSPSPRRLRYSSPILPSDPLGDGVDETIPATANSPESPLSSPLSSPQRSNLSSTYADPLSSSPPASPDSPALPKRQTAESPTTTTRNMRERDPTAPKPLTTAALRALLPKRRSQLRDRSDFDIPTSSSVEQEDNDDDDDDLAARRRRRNINKASAPQQRRKGALPSPVARRAIQGRKGGTAATAAAAGTAKTKKTYSRAITISSPSHSSSLSSSPPPPPPPPPRRSSANGRDNATSSSLSELESEDTVLGGGGGGGDDASTTPPDTSVETIRSGGGGVAAVTKTKKVSELRERKNFFAEVDQWEMEFESAPSLAEGMMGSSPAWR